jgi:hypothetical protein
MTARPLYVLPNVVEKQDQVVNRGRISGKNVV